MKCPRQTVEKRNKYYRTRIVWSKLQINYMFTLQLKDTKDKVLLGPCRPCVFDVCNFVMIICQSFVLEIKYFKVLCPLSILAVWAVFLWEKMRTLDLLLNSKPDTFIKHASSWDLQKCHAIWNLCSFWLFSLTKHTSNCNCLEKVLI